MSDLRTLHEELARVPLVERELSDVLSDITGVALRALPGAEAASITLMRDSKGFTAAYVGSMALDADELQYERGYGPCLDAAEGGQVLRIDDMNSEQRWPGYARAAADHGVVSSLSVPLPILSATVGALNTYASRSAAFDTDELILAQDVASWVARAVGTADTAARTVDDLVSLQAALKSRAVIEQAKGVLMERFKLTGERAFAVLVRASQNHNVKLRDVAWHLVHTGELLR
jgi:GAF domain-containing protein